VNLADDDQQRNLALDHLKSSRSAYYLGGLLLLAATALLHVTGHDMGLGFAIFGVVCLSIAFKHESDIRTLRMVDHLRKKYQTQGI
jgi:hypothetical protein